MHIILAKIQQKLEKRKTRVEKPPKKWDFTLCEQNLIILGGSKINWDYKNDSFVFIEKPRISLIYTNKNAIIQIRETDDTLKSGETLKKPVI